MDWNGFCATTSCHTSHTYGRYERGEEEKKKRKKKRKEKEETDIYRRLFLLAHSKAQARPVSLVIPPSPSQTIADGEKNFATRPKG